MTEISSRPKPDSLLRHLRPSDAALPGSVRERLIAGAVCTGLVAVALGAGLLIEHFLRVPNALLVFLPVVLFAAVRYGFWAAGFTSLLSILTTSYFTAPVYSFAVSDSERIWALLIFVVVAAFTSSLATQVRQRAAAVSRYSDVIAQLYALSSRLASLSRVDELAVEAATQIGSMLAADTVLLLPEAGGLRLKAASTPGAALDDRDIAAAEWCWQHARPAGRGTERIADARHTFLPLDTARGIIGVLGLHRIEPDSRLSAEESRLLDALRDQVAVSLDRAKLAEEMLETEMIAEGEKLRAALLTSISHDLRTPLASILGNVSSLREYGHLYDEVTRREMLASAEDETRRMSRFVENLLQMTRIGAGALKPTIENVDLSDLIGTALKRAAGPTSTHRIMTNLPAGLPMAALDFVLAEHVLVNLIENALKYSPEGSSISIAAQQHAGRLRVTITDEGPGIAEEDLTRIFERFFRASATDHRRAGVGLGLAICRGFVEAMGGDIAAANRRDGNGAIFTVSFPKGSVEERE